MLFLEELNPKQREAVEASDGPVLVLAGPGSGKTRVLTYRVAYLVRLTGVAPWRIMAVTFTNKAAREMKERLAPTHVPPDAIGPLSPHQLQRLTIGTFHAVCARILRRESDAMSGWDSNFVIYDSGDQVALIRQALRELNLDDKKHRPTSIHSRISTAKNELVGPDRFQAITYQEEIVHRVYKRYQELLRDNNALDFDDLLMKTLHLFRQRDDVVTAYQERYQYILVDEFQDTNMVQYELVRLLAGKHQHLFAVADEDQSIYSWRGADYRNVLRFREDFPSHRLILLEENYRSTGTILEAARHIIRHNVHRVDKHLFTHRGDGPKLQVIETYDEQEEVQYVAGEIVRLQAESQLATSQCAVMYRTNAQSRLLEEEFIRRGMPYRLVRGTRFYERREVRDILAYLRLIHNPNDGVSMARIINTPPRGIGAKTLSALENWAFKLGTSTFGALQELQEEASGTHLPWPSPFSGRSRKALLKFVGMLTTLIADRDQITLPELFDTTLSRSGYRDLVQDGSNEGEDRWENLQELRRVTQQFAGTDPTDALPLFLEQVALVSDADGLTEDSEGGPALLTLHAAKGLEFRAVFMVGMDEGMLPHKRSLDDIEAMEEERRLCYVGVTRAMDHLYLLHTFRRTIFGQSALSTPSRFLCDIPDELVEGKPQMSAPIQRPRAVSPDRSVVWDHKASPTPSHPVQPHFAIGDTVAHTKFGEGVIIGSHLTSDDQEVEVAFPGQGIKRLSVNIAPLEKVHQESAVEGKQ